MIIITAGSRFTDIDAYACGLAYCELLHAKEEHASVVLPGPLNHSVTEDLILEHASFQTEYSSGSNSERFVIVDVSDPTYIAAFVDHTRIVRLYDHHYGFEAYWQARLGAHAFIEPIGACATLIWEEFRKAGKHESISSGAANLLSAAIVSNTLNFKAGVCHPRDVAAFEELKMFTSMNKEWVETYFLEQRRKVLLNVADALRNDTKTVTLKDLGLTLSIAQMELWDSRILVDEYQDVLQRHCRTDNLNSAFVTMPDIKTGMHYLYTEDPELQKILSRVLNATFKGAVGVADKIWLRKEILRDLQRLSLSALL